MGLQEGVGAAAGDVKPDDTSTAGPQPTAGVQLDGQSTDELRFVGTSVVSGPTSAWHQDSWIRLLCPCPGIFGDVFEQNSKVPSLGPFSLASCSVPIKAHRVKLQSPTSPMLVTICTVSSAYLPSSKLQLSVNSIRID